MSSVILMCLVIQLPLPLYKCGHAVSKIQFICLIFVILICDLFISWFHHFIQIQWGHMFGTPVVISGMTWLWRIRPWYLLCYFPTSSTCKKLTASCKKVISAPKSSDLKLGSLQIRLAPNHVCRNVFLIGTQSCSQQHCNGTGHVGICDFCEVSFLNDFVDTKSTSVILSYESWAAVMSFA